MTSNTVTNQIEITSGGARYVVTFQVAPVTIHPETTPSTPSDTHRIDEIRLKVADILTQYDYDGKPNKEGNGFKKPYKPYNSSYKGQSSNGSGDGYKKPYKHSEGKPEGGYKKPYKPSEGQQDGNKKPFGYKPKFQDTKTTERKTKKSGQTNDEYCREVSRSDYYDWTSGRD